MSTNLVRIHKDITRVNIGILNKKELELFYYVCLNVKNIQDRTIVLDFSNIKKDLELTNFRDLKKYIVGLQEKLGSLRIVNISTKKIETIFLFSKFTNDLINDTLTVKVSEESLYFFNMTQNYLRFLFSDVMKLKSKYSKLLVPYLMDKSNEKVAEFEKERFFEILDVDVKYRNNLSDFNKRVLKPSVEELKDIFKDLKVNPKKNGRSIKSYIFTWTNDFNFTNNKTIEKLEIDTIEEYWKSNFLGVNYSSKHKEKIEKLKKNHSVSYIKKYLQEQWEYVKNNTDIENVPAYFSSLILGEKAVIKDYETQNKKYYIDTTEDKIQAENFVGSLFENLEKREIKAKEPGQTALYTREITQVEYDEMYKKYLETNNLEDNEVQRRIFKAMNINKYTII